MIWCNGLNIVHADVIYIRKLSVYETKTCLPVHTCYASSTIAALSPVKTSAIRLCFLSSMALKASIFYTIIRQYISGVF